MFNRKFSAIALSMLCLTGCANDNDIQQTSVSETTMTVTTSAETTANVVSEAVTTTEITTEETAEETTVTSSEKLTPEEYFSTHGYTYESYKELYIDMTNFSDGEVPLSELDNEYLDNIRYLTIQNASNADLSFLSNCPRVRTVTIENYSGNSDLSVLNAVLADKIIFRNSNEADITSLTKCQNIEEVTFDGYNGKMDLNFIAECDSVVGLTFDNVIDSTGLDVISECENITSLYIDSYNENTNLDFLSKCQNFNYLRLFNHKIDADKLSEILKQTDLTRIYIATDNYDPADGEKLIKALPECEICYCLDDSPWSDNEPWRKDYRPETDVIFYAQPFLITSANEEPWECRTSEVGYSSPYPEWIHFSSLICVFSNYSDTIKTVDSVQLYRIYDGETPILFTNGSETLKINFEIQPMKKVDFELSDEMLDYSTLETGIYKVVFTVGDEKLEQRFSVSGSSTPDFLTDEQLDIYTKAFEITNGYFGCSTYLSEEMIANTTAEEFLARICEGYTYNYAVEKCTGKYLDENGNLQATSGDRGGDISQFDEFFLPVYSDEDEVLFQNIVTHAHEDNPYFVWFETLNYRMVKTDDGWRFDNFQIWY